MSLDLFSKRIVCDQLSPVIASPKYSSLHGDYSVLRKTQCTAPGEITCTAQQPANLWYPFRGCASQLFNLPTACMTSWQSLNRHVVLDSRAAFGTIEITNKLLEHKNVKTAQSQLLHSPHTSFLRNWNCNRFERYGFCHALSTTITTCMPFRRPCSGNKTGWSKQRTTNRGTAISFRQQGMQVKR